MLCIADKSLVPQGGWRFTVRQTGTQIVGADFDRLYNRALGDLMRHRVPVPIDYRQEFEDELCHQSNIKCEVVAPVSNETRQLTAGDVLRFLKVLREWAGTGGELVPQAEADRRAEICAGCPYNVVVTGCSACQGISGTILDLINNRHSRFDSQLRGCAICACENKAQVHFPLAVLHKGVTPEMAFPMWCWKKDQPSRQQ